MQETKIVAYGNLTEKQKIQASDIFLEGFGHFMNFSKDKNKLQELFKNIMNPELFFCYIESENVRGIIGIATNKIRPLNFDENICKKLFGKNKGKILSKQMNSIFQSPVVTNENELYIDVLATAKDFQNKGIATELLKYIFNYKDYKTFFVEVFSKNTNARNLYKKNGFRLLKEKKFSFMRFLGAGYPILLEKKISGEKNK